MKPANKKLRLLNVVFLFILNIILIINIFINIATGVLGRELFYCADALYLPSLYKDLFSKYPLSGWSLPPAPCFFPDLPLYFTLNFLTGNFHISIMLFGFIQCCILLILCYYLTVVLYGNSVLPRMLFLLVSACYFLQISRIEHGILLPTLLSTFHFGAILAGTAALILVIKILSTQSSYRVKTVLLFALSGATVVSDLFFVVQFILPLIFSVLLLYILQKIELKKIMAISLSLVLPIPAGIVVIKTINRYYGFSGTSFYEHRLAFFKLQVSQWVEYLISTHYVLVGIWLTVFFSLSVMTVRAFKKKTDAVSASQDLKKTFIISFTVFCVLFNIFFCIIICSPWSRNYLAALIMPFFIGIPFLLGTLLRRGTLVRQCSVLLITLMTLAVAFPSIKNLKNLPALTQLSDYYPDMVKCFDQKCVEYGINNGISQYWAAKYLSMLSKINLHIVQVQGGEHTQPYPWNWINNLYWYNEKFEFIIITPWTPPTQGNFIDKSMILECFGQPEHIFTCQRLEVLVYNRPSDIGFHSQFNAGARNRQNM